jgi:hypothetical protein
LVSISAKQEFLKVPLRIAMEGRWNLTAKQWELVESILRPARYLDMRCGESANFRMRSLLIRPK